MFSSWCASWPRSLCLRQGSLRKAARGYHLAQGNAQRELCPTPFLQLAVKVIAHLRNLLTQAEATLTSEVSDVLSAIAKLVLTEWLVTQGWCMFLDEKARAKFTDYFKRFVDIHLSCIASELKTTFAYRLDDNYCDQLPRLARDIDSNVLLADYYDRTLVNAWLEN